MQLPPALAPWAAYLNRFSPEAAQPVGDMARRLSQAIGRPLHQSPEPGGEPEGFDGLTRKGSYQNLIAAEWLLADEFPEEFYRRAGSHEHLFLKPAFQKPSAVRQSIVLFDCGPDQLGAPRIVHMSLLIVFARRAEAAGNDLHWGVLQSYPDKMQQGVSETGIQHFLEARSFLPFDENLFGVWRAHLESFAQPLDLWVIGPDQPHHHALSSRRVFIEDQRVDRLLEVRIVRPSGTSRISLEPPPDDMCRSLLHNPFQRPQVGSNKTLHLDLDPRAGMLISRDGIRMAVRKPNGIALVIPIPESANTIDIRPRKLIPPKNHSILSVGMVGRKLLRVLRNDNIDQADHGTSVASDRIKFDVSRVGKFNLPELKVQDELFHGQEMWECFLTERRKKTEVYFWDRRSDLYRVDPDSGTLDLMPNVFSVIQKGPHLVYAFIHDNEVRIAGPSKSNTIIRHQPFFPNLIDEGYLMGGTQILGRLETPTEPVGLFREKGGGWILAAMNTNLKFRNLPAGRVVGGAFRLLSGGLENYGAVVLADNHRDLLIHFADGKRQKAPRAQSPIVQVQVHPDGDRIFSMTDRGCVQVYSVADDCLLLEIRSPL